MSRDTEDMTLARLQSLLQPAFSGILPDEDMFAGMEPEAWNTLYRRAAEEGVLAVAFDGVMRLPKNLHPPKMLMLTWGAGVNNIEQHHARFTEIAGELASRFGAEDIPMLIFKGISLAQYYPVPAHREFGDLDIYLFGNHKKGDRLLRQWGAHEEKNHFSYKHSVFKYKGVNIENHACFLNVRNSRGITALNSRLVAMAETELKNAPDKTLLFPSPDFTALFFMTHALSHFVATLPAGRYFYDWAVFLHANKGKWDRFRYGEALSEAGIRKVADVFTAFTVDFTGLPLDEAPPFERDKALEEKIRTAMRNPLPPLSAEDKRSIWKRIVYKYRRIKDRRWRSELVFPGAYYKMILFSVYYHLRHPERIWK